MLRTYVFIYETYFSIFLSVTGAKLVYISETWPRDQNGVYQILSYEEWEVLGAKQAPLFSKFVKEDRTVTVATEVTE